MNKKVYQNPTTAVIEIQQTHMFCVSDIKKVESGEVGITYGNAGSSEAARVKGNSVDWHEDWSE